MIAIREQKVEDAQRFFDILQNPNFLYFAVIPPSLEAEIEYIKENKTLRENGTNFNYAITKNNEVVGGIGVKINQHRKYIGEAGYFIDEAFWGQGIAAKAMELIENELVSSLGIKRLELLMDIRNKASERVAIKSGFQKEGILRNVLKERSGEFADCYLYSKIF